MIAGDQSHLHRISATETWLYHSRAPLVLSLPETYRGPARGYILRPDIVKGHMAQIIASKARRHSARVTQEIFRAGTFSGKRVHSASGQRAFLLNHQAKPHSQAPV
ncbi:cupin domain-containing protein [Aliiroseovarius salicola]|uniref:cupin domain-containing protein n=1 Tax=Aliiroseovarius salicola TaxID=3009082 RepID=UPI0038CC1A27